MQSYELYGSVQNVLSAWARWRWENHGADIGYPKQCPFRRLMLVEGEANLPAALMDDELALGVDRAVGALKVRSQSRPGDHRWVVIMDSYLGGYLDRQIAYHHRISRSTVRTARIAGENWIEGKLLTEPVLTRK